jgi:hypothetical protein
LPPSDAERIAEWVERLHPHHHHLPGRAGRRHVAAHQGQVLGVLDLGVEVARGPGRARAQAAGPQAATAALAHDALALEPIRDHVGDRQDHHAVLAAELVELGPRAISPSSRMISQMMPAGLQARQARQVDRPFGLAGAHQHSASARAQREDVARRHHVVGLGVVGDGGQDRVCSDRAPLMPVVTPCRASMLTVNAVPSEAWLLRHHRRSSRRSTMRVVHGQADQAAAVLGHEVDGLGRDAFGGDAQVALVLAIFVVDQDDHLASAHLLERARHPGDGAGVVTGHGAHGVPPSLVPMLAPSR